MLAQVNTMPQLPSMVFGALRCRPDADVATLPSVLWAVKQPPSVPIRYLDTPAKLFGILNNLFDVLVWVPGSSHTDNDTARVNTCQHTLFIGAVIRKLDRKCLYRPVGPADSS